MELDSWSWIRKCYKRRKRGGTSAEEQGMTEQRQYEEKFQEQIGGNEIRQKHWAQAQEYGPKKEALIQDHTICLGIRN